MTAGHDSALRHMIVLLMASLIAGCGSGYTAINSRDDEVFFPSLRGSVPLFDQDGRHGRSDHALEAELSQGKGAGRQSLESGTVSLAGTTLTGPTDIQHTFGLDVADIDLRFRFPCSARIFGEFLAGFRYTDLDLRLQSGSVSAQRDFADAGFIIGLGTGIHLAGYLTLDLRFIADLNNGDRQMHSNDLLASYWLSPHTAVTVGYKRWRYGRNIDGESDIDSLVWSGFSGGFAYSF